MSTNTKQLDGTDRLPLWRVGIFGLGNFASNLSWTMVSTYLALFYTDAVGLSAAAVATMLLVSRVWDAANDPIMGLIAERTRSKWGRFRPYILFGPPVLVVGTLLVFRNPGMGTTGSLVYAYITYSILTMVYTATNVPYNGMALAITRNRSDVARLGAASMTGMNVAMMILNMVTMSLITFFGQGDMSRGYQFTAGIYVITGMFLFWVVFAGTKEVITFTKKSVVPLSKSFKVMFSSRNIVCYILNQTLFFVGMMGRIGIAVYYYLHVVHRPDLIGIFMSLPTVVGIIVFPFAPAFARKLGAKKAVLAGTIIHLVGLIMILFTDVTNIPLLIFAHIIYGSGYIGGMSGAVLLRDAVDEAELKTGHRIDGTVSGFTGFATKTGGAIGSSLGLFVIGLAGYVGGQEVTSTIANGINQAVNLVPLICFAASFIVLLFYNLTEKKGKEINLALEARRSKETEASEETF